MAAFKLFSVDDKRPIYLLYIADGVKGLFSNTYSWYWKEITFQKHDNYQRLAIVTFVTLT